MMKRSVRKIFLLLGLSNNVSPFVRSAYFTYVMGSFQFSALIALDHARHLELEMCTALIAAGFGSSSCWNCHG